MAEDNNDILEEETDAPPASDDTSEREVESDDKASTKDKPVLFGLSKSLLIKIGIGVAALLVVTGLALFFLMDSSETEEADPMLLDAPIDSDTENPDSLSLEDDQAAVLPEIETGMEDDEESVVLPTVVKKQTDEDGNLLPSENLIDPMPSDLPSVNDSPVPSDIAVQQTGETDTLAPDEADSTATVTTSDNNSPDKLLKEVMALQQQLNKQQSTNQELIKQIQALSNENKSLKNEDLTASDYVAPATPSFTDDDKTESSNDRPIQYQEYRYSQQHKLDIGPQWGDVKPDLSK